METKFNFNSQICTTREQSERLIALGLRKETADMVYYRESSIHNWGILATPWRDDFEGSKWYYPAWSLNRLLLLIPREASIDGFTFPLRYDALRHMNEADDMYEYITGVLERTIKEGYFNKEYLKK